MYTICPTDVLVRKPVLTIAIAGCASMCFLSLAADSRLVISEPYPTNTYSPDSATWMILMKTKRKPPICSRFRDVHSALKSGTILRVPARQQGHNKWRGAGQALLKLHYFDRLTQNNRARSTSAMLSSNRGSSPLPSASIQCRLPAPSTLSPIVVNNFELNA